jgi:hypothetical protein
LAVWTLSATLAKNASTTTGAAVASGCISGDCGRITAGAPGSTVREDSTLAASTALAASGSAVDRKCSAASAASCTAPKDATATCRGAITGGRNSAGGVGDRFAAITPESTDPDDDGPAAFPAATADRRSGSGFGGAGDSAATGRLCIEAAGGGIATIATVATSGSSVE